MKFDKKELIAKAKCCIDDFCMFMYFLWNEDKLNGIDRISGKPVHFVNFYINRRYYFVFQ